MASGDSPTWNSRTRWASGTRLPIRYKLPCRCSTNSLLIITASTLSYRFRLKPRNGQWHYDKIGMDSCKAGPTCAKTAFTPSGVGVYYNPKSKIEIPDETICHAKNDSDVIGGLPCCTRSKPAGNYCRPGCRRFSGSGGGRQGYRDERTDSG